MPPRTITITLAGHPLVSARAVREAVYTATHRVRVPLVAVFADGCRVELAHGGDAETECDCARHAPLLGLLARAA